MPSDLENRTMELLTTVVEDEQKSITYRWLSRSMGVSVNVAKQFMETYLATVGKGKACGTYYVARQEAGTGNRAISLVTQEELDAIKNDEAVTGHHIYSVQPSPLKDLAILSVSNFEASQLQQGKDLNTYRVIHNPHVVVSKSNARPGVAAPSTSTSIAAKTAAAATPGLSGTKPGLTSTSSLSATSLAPKSTTTTPANGTDSSTTHTKTKPASGSKPSMMSFFGKAATTTAAAPKKTPVSAATSSSSSSSTSPSKKPSSTLNFKSAAPPQKRKADSMLVTPSNPTTASGAADPPQESEEDEEEVDSEEERDRRLALSSRLDQDQGDVVVVNGAGNHPETQSAKKEAMNVDADAIKKRQRSARRLAIDDDDDDDDDAGENDNVDHDFAGSNKSAPVDMEEDEESIEVMTKEARAALNMEKEAQRLALENMMLMDDTTADLDKDEDSPMIDVEALDPKEDSSDLTSVPSSTIETVTRDGVVVRRRRGVRAVTKRKTSRNERGYMVTEDVVVMEPFSEDEIIQAPTPARAPAPVRAAKPAEPTKGKTEAAPKKKAGSGNQSLLNFFSKK
ncbi:DNA polymerase delta subunit 3 [Mortierella alpina]|nr:DNA polymerase delta subunit 3 [Mortierella alpina]